MAWVVKTWSPGSLLIRPAPPRMALWAAREMPLRLERMLPASLLLSLGSLNFLGGRKSSAVKVPDLRRSCLGWLVDIRVR